MSTWKGRIERITLNKNSWKSHSHYREISILKLKITTAIIIINFLYKHVKSKTQ